MQLQLSELAPGDAELAADVLRYHAREAAVIAADEEDPAARAEGAVRADALKRVAAALQAAADQAGALGA